MEHCSKMQGCGCSRLEKPLSETKSEVAGVGPGLSSEVLTAEVGRNRIDGGEPTCELVRSSMQKMRRYIHPANHTRNFGFCCPCHSGSDCFAIGTAKAPMAPTLRNEEGAARASAAAPSQKAIFYRLTRTFSEPARSETGGRKLAGRVAVVRARRPRRTSCTGPSLQRGGGIPRWCRSASGT